MPRAASKGVTIQDVARAAKVSVATVSRVVRDHDDVSSATRLAVQKVIEELGYRPSPIARALVSGRAGLVALLVSDIANPFYPQLAHSVEREFASAGYGLVICNTADDPNETARHLQVLTDRGVEGFIHASVGQDESLFQKTVPGVPVVFANRRPSQPEAAFVVADNVGAGAAITRHLLDLGHQRIAFVGGPLFASNGHERELGYKEVMKGNGLKSQIVRGDFTMASGRDHAAKLIAKGERKPTAIIGVNDFVALGVLEAMYERGLRAPGDLAVAGFDNIELASSTIVNLTSVAEDIEYMGQRAASGLRELLGRSRRVQPQVIQEVLECRVVPRATTVGTEPKSAPMTKSKRLP